MSRPLTGSLKANPSGTFTASLPAERGSKARPQATFTTRREAEQWLQEAIAARNAGHSMPPTGPRSSRRAGSGTGFRTIAELWIQEHYVEDGHGDVDREKQVRGYLNVIDAYLMKHNLNVEAITRPEQGRRRARARELPDVGTAPARAPRSWRGPGLVPADA